MRKGDTLARIGGDEFKVVLVDLELPQDYDPILTRLLNTASRLLLSMIGIARIGEYWRYDYPPDG